MTTLFSVTLILKQVQDISGSNSFKGEILKRVQNDKGRDAETIPKRVQNDKRGEVLKQINPETSACIARRRLRD
jgi:hypothetical protein